MTSAKLLLKKQRLEAFAYDSAVSHFFTGYTNFSVIIEHATLALGLASQWINTSSPSWRDWRGTIGHIRNTGSHFLNRADDKAIKTQPASPPVFISQGISLCVASPRLGTACNLR